jgi:small GTP-binding protein
MSNEKENKDTLTKKNSYYIAVLGDCNVGKSELIRKYINPEDNDMNDSLIGINILEKKIGNNEILKIIETSGQERDKKITNIIYKNAIAYIIVFDMNNEESYNNIKLWLDLIENNAHKIDPIIYIVGIENDEGNTNVKKKEDIEVFLWGYNKIKKIDYEIINTKTNKNINKVFEGIIEMINISNEGNNQLDKKLINEKNSFKCYLY